jgi:hypothetical protein
MFDPQAKKYTAGVVKDRYGSFPVQFGMFIYPSQGLDT